MSIIIAVAWDGDREHMEHFWMFEAETDLEAHGMAETDYQCLIVWLKRRMEPK